MYSNLLKYSTVSIIVHNFIALCLKLKSMLISTITLVSFIDGETSHDVYSSSLNGVVKQEPGHVFDLQHNAVSAHTPGLLSLPGFYVYFF